MQRHDAAHFRLEGPLVGLNANVGRSGLSVCPKKIGKVICEHMNGAQCPCSTRAGRTGTLAASCTFSRSNGGVRRRIKCIVACAPDDAIKNPQGFDGHDCGVAYLPSHNTQRHDLFAISSLCMALWLHRMASAPAAPSRKTTTALPCAYVQHRTRRVGAP